MLPSSTTSPRWWTLVVTAVAALCASRSTRARSFVAGKAAPSRAARRAGLRRLAVGVNDVKSAARVSDPSIITRTTHVALGPTCEPKHAHRSDEGEGELHVLFFLNKKKWVALFEELPTGPLLRPSPRLSTPVLSPQTLLLLLWSHVTLSLPSSSILYSTFRFREAFCVHPGCTEGNKQGLSHSEVCEGWRLAERRLAARRARVS